MGSHQLVTLEILGAFWKTPPFECSTDPRLEREFDRIPAKIKRSVIALGLQKYLGISKSCSGDCPQVFC
jgi:hypothetical protein